MKRFRFWKVGLADMLKLGTYDRDATPAERTMLAHEGPKGWGDRNEVGDAVRLADGSFLVCLHLPGFPGSDVTAPDETEIAYYHAN